MKVCLAATRTNRMRTALALVGVLAASLAAASAQTNTHWLNPGAGAWENAANWDAGVPSFDHNALVNTGTATITTSDACAAWLSIAETELDDAVVRIAGGAFVASGEAVGSSGTASLVHSGGTNACTSLAIGVGQTAVGAYDLLDGSLTASYIAVGGQGEGTFHQATGNVSVFGGFDLGYDVGGHGTYELEGGTLSTGAAGELIGRAPQAIGTFIQTAGTHTVPGNLICGSGVDAEGHYQLAGDSLAVNASLVLGHYGHGTFLQSGGECTVAMALYVGFQGETGSGVCTLSGGSMSAGSLQVASYDGLTEGRLEITSPAANLTISGQAAFGAGASLTAVSGSAMSMTGDGGFDLSSTDAANMSGLRNLELVFTGNPQPAPLEVAGADLGPEASGLNGNFALGALTVGSDAPGNVRLVDEHANSVAARGAETLYVETLSVGPGSQLDLNGLNLYYASGHIDEQATILGGWPTELAGSPGDLNCDGSVDFDDIDAFVVALTGEAAYEAQYPECRWMNGDCDLDGDVDFDDIDAFVVLLSQP
jgi:hypothetical protein